MDTSESKTAINDRFSNFVSHDLAGPAPTVDRAKGIYIWDTDGKRYIDGASGAAVTNIGHGVEEIGAAMAEQAGRVAYTFRSNFTSDPIEQTATMIADMAPGDLNRVFFVSSGSEATEMAAKLAKGYFLSRGMPLKERVISLTPSYHGITTGALSMSGHIARRRNYVNSLLPYPKIPAPYCYRCPEGKSYPTCGVSCADRLSQVIEQYGQEYIAAFIVEPIIGASAAAVSGPPEYLGKIREICDHYDILMIADEVMTGFGRTGANFGVDHWDVVPDMIAFAKGAASGYYPLGGVILSDRVLDKMRDGSGGISAGHTFSGTPLGGAVGKAVLTYLQKHDLVENSRVLGGHLFDRLAALKDKHPMIGDVRGGHGLFAGVEFVKNKATKAPFDLGKTGAVAALILQKTLARGLIVYPGSGAIDGRRGDHILLAPPLVINREQLDDMVDWLDLALTDAETELDAMGAFT